MELKFVFTRLTKAEQAGQALYLPAGASFRCELCAGKLASWGEILVIADRLLRQFVR
jgi:hypothetical protein